MKDLFEIIGGAAFLLTMWLIGAFFSALPFLMVVWYLKH